jgi:hypothetical protein
VNGMTPETFRELYARAVAAGPVDADVDRAIEDIAAGGRRLISARRRRLAVSTVALVASACVAGYLGISSPGDPAPTTSEVPTRPPATGSAPTAAPRADREPDGHADRGSQTSDPEQGHRPDPGEHATDGAPDTEGPGPDDGVAPDPAIPDRGGDDPTPLDTAPSLSGRNLVDECRGTPGDQQDVASVFGPGQPTTMAALHTGFQNLVVLEAADGRSYGACFLDRAGQRHTDLHASAIDHEPTSGAAGGWRPTWLQSDACGDEEFRFYETCRAFWFAYVDVLPSDVAAVEFSLGNGESRRVRTTHGYVALNYLGSLPPGTRLGAQGHVDGQFHFVDQITYLDSAGQPLAATRFAPPVGRVGNLPQLDAFPSHTAW